MKPQDAKWTRFRIAVVFVTFAMVFGMILWRSLELQVLEREKLAKLADAQCSLTVKIQAPRGSILDRNSDKLAVSIPMDSIFVEPAKLEKPDQAAAQLAKALNVNRQELTARIKKSNTFAWVKRLSTPEERARVEALNIEGIGFVKEGKRFYPNKTMASHVLGFVGLDEKGLEGLELSYDKYLTGEEVDWRLRRDARGKTYLASSAASPEEEKAPQVRLTLDRRVQYVTDKALAKAVETYNAKGGLALVVRPQTGEILAMSVYPSFNPNNFNKFDPALRRNRIVTDVFDPGSTFKVFVVAAALDEGVVRPQDTFFCENGNYAIGGRVVHDHERYGTLSVNQIIKVSSNIGTAKIGDKLGNERLHKYLTSFTFGQKTGVDFPGESTGLLRSYKNWRKIDAANVAFGQGVSVTALQMVMAMSTIANDGILMKPYIVSEIMNGKGETIHRTSPEMVRQVISKQTAREVQAMLRMVVQPGGTGTAAETDGYPAAGKTGTAQKIDPVTKAYSDDKYFSSFLGFVPYNNPQLTIMVALDQPGPKIYGGTVAAPAFREIAEQVLPLLNVPPMPSALPSDPRDSAPKAPVKPDVRTYSVKAAPQASSPDSDSVASSASPRTPPKTREANPAAAGPAADSDLARFLKDDLEDTERKKIPLRTSGNAPAASSRNPVTADAKDVLRLGKTATMGN